MRVNLWGQHRWEKISGGGLEIEVMVSPMGHIERIVCGEIFGDHRVATERTTRPDGTTTESTVTIPAVDANSRGIKYALDHTVNDWRGIEGEDGKPLPFTPDNLDKLMGFYPEWGAALMAVVERIAGLSRAGAGAPDPRVPTVESPPNS